MINITDNLDIEINRGDAAGLTIHFEGDDAPSGGVSVIFQVKPAYHYDTVIIEKEVPILEQDAEIGFGPDDTKDLKPGTYYWNACIQFENGLEPWTVLSEWPEFRVLA